MKIGLSFGIWFAVCSLLWVLAEGLVSFYVTKNFTPDQTWARWKMIGISLKTHGGWYGDMLLPVLFAWVVITYGAAWDMKLISIMLVVGVIITLINHLLLINTQIIPDPWAWKGEKWSTLIAMHFVYMSVYVALAGLFYFSHGVSVAATVTVSVVLGIHMMFGTHIPLGILNLWHHWEWCPTTFLSVQVAWMQLGIWATLAILATVAAGWRAGASVAAIACAIAIIVLRIIHLSPR